MGVGSTLKACAIDGRQGIGFELNERYSELAKLRIEKEVLEYPNGFYEQQVIHADAREAVLSLEENSVDFVVTSPPYWNILHKEDHKVKQERKAKDLDTKYSEDQLDLGNIDDYDLFLKEVANILGKCGKPLKPKKYMAIIVSDFREKSKYIMFHAHLSDALREYGLALKGRVFPYGYPYSYVPNIHHQYIIILQNEKSA